MSDRRIQDLTELTQDTAEAVLGLIAAGAAEDGQPAVSERGRLHVRRGAREGVRHLLLWAPGAGGEGATEAAEATATAPDAAAGAAAPAATATAGAPATATATKPAAEAPRTPHQGPVLAGYGQIDGTDPVEAPAAEFLVHPAHRSHGHGRALGQALLAASGNRLRVWAHGGHPAARHLAIQLGLKLFRELRQLRRPLDPEVRDLPDPRLPAGVTVRTFVPGQDDAAWLAVNAAAFAHHPEQGSLTQRDLDDRKAEPWFDPAGFFLAFRGPVLAGFHWTKAHPEEGLGEVYVLGVAPGEQGTGLGRALTTIGLRHLAGDRGLGTAMLYVDADNTAALAVYERLGFTLHEADLMYRSES